MNDFDSILNQSISKLSVFSDLPDNFKDLLLKHRKIKSLYEWQYECLEMDSVVNSTKNLVYSSPTSGGKTLVSEILLIREVVKRKKSAIFVLPFVSIVNEKVASLVPFGLDLQFHVEEYAGSKGVFPPRKRHHRCSIYIATIEKASMLINSFIEEKRTNDIGMVVVDELHMVHENSHRSAKLELMLAKILYCYGMSATLPKKKDCLLEFLQADFYDCKYRPIKLHEYIVNTGKVYKVNTTGHQPWNETLEYVRNLTLESGNSPSLIEKMGWNSELLGIFTLVGEIIPHNSCLIFCPSKKNAQVMAKAVATSLAYREDLRLYNQEKEQQRMDLVTTIETTQGGICAILRVTLRYGVAYHHSGLTEIERHLIEEAYIVGLINVICCTSTLAAGVNLPARRVILRSPYVANTVLTNVNYKQMVGRAGRAGIDEVGESFIIVDSSSYQVFASSNNGMSFLGQFEEEQLSTTIVSLIGLKICSDVDQIKTFFHHTLYYISLIKNNDSGAVNDFNNKISLCIESLIKSKFLMYGRTFEGVVVLKTTDIGNGVYQSGISMKRLEQILKKLDKAQYHMNLESDLYLLYLCVDPEMDFVITDPLELDKIINGFTENELHTLSLLGFSRQYIYSKMANASSHKNNLPMDVMKPLSNLFILHRLMRGRSSFEVASSFGVSGAYINQLISSTISFGSMLHRFTKELSKYWTMHVLIGGMVDRMISLSMSGLLELMSIPRVKLNRAKQLHAKGYKTVNDIANATPKKLCEDIENLPKGQARIIHRSATLIMMEKVEALLDEANQIADDSKENKIITQFYCKQSK